MSRPTISEPSCRIIAARSGSLVTWQPGAHYKISLDAGVADQFGQPAPAFSGEVSLDDLTPSMFVGRDVGLLEASGVTGSFQVQRPPMCPVSEIRALVARAGLKRLRAAQLHERRPAGGQRARLMSRRELPITKIRKNEPRLHGIDLRQVFKDGKKTGLVLARVSAPDAEGDPARVLVQITDVIAHAKIGLTSGVVWVTSAPDAARHAARSAGDCPLAGRKDLSAGHRGSGRSGHLTGAGAARSRAGQERLGAAGASSVRATDQGDTGVVTTNWSDIAHEGVEGASYDGLSPTPVGTVFTDRGIYRPGDTVHVKGLLRRRAGDSPSGIATPAGKTVVALDPGPPTGKIC